MQVGVGGDRQVRVMNGETLGTGLGSPSPAETDGNIFKCSGIWPYQTHLTKYHLA